MANENKDMVWRMYLVYFSISIVGVLILVQIFRIQYLEKEELSEQLTTEKYKLRTIDAARGNIFADNGTLLATSVPIYDIRIDTKAEALTDEYWTNNYDSLAIALANLFPDEEATYRHFEQLLRKGRDNNARYLTLKKGVNYDQMHAVKKMPIIRRGRYRGGAIIEQRNDRINPYGLLAQRTLGDMNDEGALVGLELAYDPELRGEDGEKLMKRLVGDVWMPVGDNNEIDPVEGADLMTTINVKFQDVAE